MVKGDELDKWRQMVIYEKCEEDRTRLLIKMHFPGSEPDYEENSAMEHSKNPHKEVWNDARKIFTK